MDIKLEYTPSEKQTLFHTCEAMYTLFGGAKGGGKSVALVNECIQLSLDYPGNRGFLCRRQYSDFKISTLLTLLAWLPSKLIRKHSKGDKYIQFINNSVLYYGGLDEESNINKLNSAEFGFFAVDQAEEMDSDDFIKLGGTLRLKLKSGKHPRFRGLLSANPAPGWLKQLFITSPADDHVFIQSLPSDNPFLEASYVNRLKQLYRNRPNLLNAYIYGSWDELEGTDIIIPYHKIMESIGRRIDKTNIQRVVACDPSSSSGQNESVIYGFENGHQIYRDVFTRESTIVIASKLSIVRKKIDADLIVLDSGGMGVGVVDNLRKLKEKFIGINSATKSRFPKKFKNIKAEMWWTVADMFGDGLVSLESDMTAVNQLSGVKYVPDSSPLQVEDKKKSIKRLGGSPDRADAIILGLFGLRYAPTRKGETKQNYPKPDRYSRGSLVGAGSFMSA